MKIKRHKRFDNIFLFGKEVVTKSLVPGEKVYGERTFTENKVEYRVWDFYRSKPSAALKKGIKHFPLKKGMKILYLGIASGTTASHFSDIIGKKGIIYGVEISKRSLRDLISVAEKRENIVPILADARRPESYENIVIEKVDLLYEDVANPDQINILIWNKRFLKNEGYAMIAIKSQSIDVTKPPSQVYKDALKKLKIEFDILDKVELDPYEKAHMFVVMKVKK